MTGWRDAWPPAGARHLPAAGLLVGGFGALVLWGSAHLWTAAVAVGLSMVATLWLTAAAHEAGLAATCDALAGAAGRERALEIMADPRIGARGTLGLLAVLGLKAAALLGLAQRDLDATLVALPLAHALSRAAPVLLLRLLRHAGEPVRAASQANVPRADDAAVAIALAWCLAAATAAAWRIDGLHLVFAAAAALAVTLQTSRWLQRHLGGFTRATLGATQQGAELAIYLALLAAAAQG